MTLPRILTIMGSGETAPTMVKTHRALIERLGPSAKAVVLDTPYGFQENAAELATRAQDYFRASVGHPIEVAGLQQLHGADELSVAQGLARLHDATYLFAGPGSPTYALRQWAGSAVPGAVAAKLRHGGAVTFASAAALTLGRLTVPVYEIYKVGEDPYWLDGLNLLAEIGINASVIPHYDNAEGGHHDTRFCYLGERRLRMLEALMPEDMHVIGIDEHTGIVVDIDAERVTVVGNGTITIRKQGESTVFPTGTELHLDQLRQPGSAGVVRSTSAVTPAGVDAPAGSSKSTDDTSLSATTERCEAGFSAAIESRDASAAVRAALELDAAIHAWSADTLQSDDADRARLALRSMIVRLGEAADGGLQDPRATLSPLVDALLALRATVRAEKRYDLSDIIRDRMLDAGVEVRDTKAGVEWVLRSAQ